MGQYYRPLVIFESGEEKYASAHDFGNGLKLMEHSWIGNNFVNVILHEIEDTPARVAWIGDYADAYFDETCNLGSGFITSVEDFMSKYNDVWESSEIERIPSDTPMFKLDIGDSDCYLVNTTKKCYIDMEEYVKKNCSHGYNLDIWCINPLPLLTCIGNGLGGGDYHGISGKEYIGSWAFDKIYVTYLRPGSMEKVNFHFSE